MSKIHFRSKSQLLGQIGQSLKGCFQYVKDTLSKQITTQFSVISLLIMMFPICQRYTFEANHNFGSLTNIWEQDVSNMSKIHFRSKSQQRDTREVDQFGCFQYVKDTLSKQITTLILKLRKPSSMFPICQRYTFEANHNLRMS